MSYFGRTFSANAASTSARFPEFVMNSIATVHAPARVRLTLLFAGIVALLGSCVVTAPAQAGYYEGYGYNPCSYRCGYPAYHYYPRYRQHYGCYSCGRHLIYERRYVEREYVERRYGYGGYRRHYGYNPYYRRHYGCNPCEGYRPSGYGGGYGYGGGGYGYGGGGYGYGGVGRRWPVPPLDGDGPYAGGYEDPPRPPAPIWDGREY
jgi:hypothetical protein